MVYVITDKNDWDKYVQINNGHPLQLWGWGEVKSKHGWKAHRLVVSEHPWAGAQVLIRPLPKPFGCLAYIPRGPVGQWSEAEYAVLADYVKTTFRPVMLTMEPATEKLEMPKAWLHSSQTILLPRTVLLKLERSEEELLQGMSKKTRQYIRKSEKDGVTVRRAVTDGDIAKCLAIYHDTAKRAGFALHDDDYYLDVWRELGEASPVYVAEHEGQVVSFLWLVASDEIAFELYGGVTDAGQAVRANYVLKWQAICDLRESGVKHYDLNGLLNDGISSFKLSFSNGQETQLSGTFDAPLSPLYFFWKKALPLAKRIVRALANR